MSVHVRFRVGDENFALPVGQVLEVADLGQLAPVPGAPPAVLGVRNLRGHVLPVIDLAVVLGTAHARPGARLVIAIDDQDRVKLSRKVLLREQNKPAPGREGQPAAPREGGNR